MIFLLGILVIVTLSDLVLLFYSWVEPRIVKRFPFEPGRDNEVSHREMRRRRVWRYDSWVERILSLLLFVLLSFIWGMVLLHR